MTIDATDPFGGAASQSEVGRDGRRIARRRWTVAVAGAGLWAAMAALAAAMLAPGGFDAIEIGILVSYALHLPWALFGFLNASIGFLVMRFARDPLAATCPPVAAARPGALQPSAGHGHADGAPTSTAILWCVRNEDCRRVFRNIALMIEDLGSSGFAEGFALYVLSDTSDPVIAEAEEAAFAGLRERFGAVLPLVYRRRTDNSGYKAGNIRDFALRFGGAHDFALVLDADSYMTAAKIRAMVAVMAADPSLGILQSLVVGLPTASPLARLFQFGMRLGMRSYTLGSAWWHADCGPYWGHNALIRIAPFAAHCDLPRLSGAPPFGGDILSHDQVEAVLMRRAGYEVRVWPEEGGSYEENPPTLVEFVRREMRWCLGNNQYWRLLGLPGLEPASRFQLVVAVAMFVASPTFLLMWGLALVEALARKGEVWLDPAAGLVLLGLTLAMTFAPKIASIADVLMSPEKRRGFGGGARFLAGALTETVFSFLVVPVTITAHTATMAALIAGRTVGWTAQLRDARVVGWGEALARFWPQTLTGVAALAGLVALTPIAAVYAAPVYLGLVLAVPLAVLTADPAIGAAMRRVGLCAIPEEIDPPAEVQALTADVGDR